MGQSLDGEFGMTKILGLAIRTASIICLCFGTLFSTAAVAQNALVIPTWTDLFNADGSLKDAVDASRLANPNGVPDYADYGGIDAVFVGDWISDGVATDMSALSDANDLSDVIVWNGTVRTEHDVGNAANAGCHHWQAAGMSFHQRHRCDLGQTRQHKQVGACQLRGHSVPIQRADKFDLVFDAELCRS